MNAFKSRRRKPAERVVDHVPGLRDDAVDALKPGRRTTLAKRTTCTKPSTGKAFTSNAERLDRNGRRDVRAWIGTGVGRNIGDLVRENPGAAIGGAMALAVAIGAGASNWVKRD